MATGAAGDGDAFSRLMGRVTDRVQASPRLVLAATLLLTALCAVYSVENLRIDTDTADMISDELPFRQNFKAFRAAFPALSDNVAIVIDAPSPDRADEAAAILADRLRAAPGMFPLVFSPETDPFFLRHGLLYLDREELQRLSNDLADAQGLLTRLAGDPTLRGLETVLSGAARGLAEDSVYAARLADVLDRLARAARAAAGGEVSPVSWRTLIAGTEDGGPARRIILTKPRVDFGSLAPAAEAMQRIRAIAREAGLTAGNDVTVRLTGGVVISTEELESVTEGARQAGFVSLVLVACLLAWGIRSVRLVAAILVALLAGLVWTAAFTTLAIGHLNLVSVAFAVLFIGLGVDFGIHFALRFREERQETADRHAALRRTVDGLAGALGLCALAAAISFFSFVPTAYRGLSELGLIAGVGMFLAFAATFVLIPAVLAVMPARGEALPPPRMRPWLPDRRVAIVAVALGGAAAATLPFARFDFDPIKLRDPETESVRTFRDLAETPGASPYTIEVLADSLSAAHEIASRLEAMPEVEKTVTAADLVPSDQEAKLAVIDDLNVFLAPLTMPAPPAPPLSAEDREKAVAALRDTLAAMNHPALSDVAAELGAALADLDTATEQATFERAVFRFFDDQIARLRAALAAGPVALEDLPAEIRRRYLSKDGRARVEVYPSENLEDPEALRRFVGAVRRIAPGATDGPVEILEAGRAVVRSVVTAAAISVVAVTLMLLVVLRSLRDTLLVLVPLTLAALYTVAATVILGMAFNFANVIVLPLLMGLGVASGIHLVARAREGRSGMDAFGTTTPRAVIFSALTTIASFGSLAISSHRGTASMGELLTLSISLTLVCTLVVLPSLMRLWPSPERSG